MGKIYNISLDKNFLETVASFLKEEIDPKELRHYTAILPNNRSCRVFSKYLAQNKNKNEDNECFTWNIGEAKAKIRKFISVSDLITYNSPKISSRISLVLRKRNPNIPVSTIFELAQSVNDLIKDLLLNNVEYDTLRDLVPEDLRENWQHTLDMIKECVNDEKIKENLSQSRKEIRNLRNPQDNLMLVGVGNTNFFTKSLVESVIKSKNGLIFLTGDRGSLNESYNKEILGRFAWEELNKNIKEIKKFKQQNSAKEKQIEFIEFPNIMAEAEGIGEIVAQSSGSFNSVLIVAPNVDLSRRIKSDLQQRNIIADDSFGDTFSKNSRRIIDKSAFGCYFKQIYYAILFEDIQNS